METDKWWCQSVAATW